MENAEWGMGDCPVRDIISVERAFTHSLCPVRDNILRNSRHIIIGDTFIFQNQIPYGTRNSFHELKTGRMQYAPTKNYN